MTVWSATEAARFVGNSGGGMIVLSAAAVCAMTTLSAADTTPRPAEAA